MENGLITKGARLLIPSTLRRKVLEQIHDGHLGIEKCMLKARDSVFWPVFGTVYPNYSSFSDNYLLSRVIPKVPAGTQTDIDTLAYSSMSSSSQ